MLLPFHPCGNHYWFMLISPPQAMLLDPQQKDNQRFAWWALGWVTAQERQLLTVLLHILWPLKGPSEKLSWSILLQSCFFLPIPAETYQQLLVTSLPFPMPLDPTVKSSATFCPVSTWMDDHSRTSVVILYYHRKHKLPYCPGYIASGQTIEKTVLLALVV
jgi:hypothetical protein